MIQKLQKHAWTILILLGAIFVPMLIQRAFVFHILILITIFSIMGMGWNIIGGYAGQISNGHALFYGIGAYASAIGMAYYEISPWVSIWIGMFFSVSVAFILGKPLLRLQGHYFSVATMAIAECGRIIFANWDFVGGATGVDFLNKTKPTWYTMQFLNKETYYYVFLAFMILVFFITARISDSKFGYYLRAIKANPVSAESIGIDTSYYKLLAFMVSAVIVSLAGSLYANYLLYIDPNTVMTLEQSMMICLVVVMGGVGTKWGPILGAIILTIISEVTRATFASITGLNLFIYGILVIVIVLFLPGGIISIGPKIKQLVVEKR